MTLLELLLATLAMRPPSRIWKNLPAVMSKPDAKYVASDKAEIDRVRENFLKKKLKIEAGGLDGALKRVCEKMVADRTKSRLTFYYALAEHLDKLETL